MAKETKLRADLNKYIRTRNGLTITNFPSMYGTKGVPDTLWLHKYWKGFVETKAEGNTLTDAQLDFAEMCWARGFPCVCITFPAYLKSVKPNSLVRLQVFRWGKNTDIAAIDFIDEMIEAERLLLYLEINCSV